MPDVQLTDRDHSELLLLYEASVAEIAGFKQQQWVVTNYVLIAQASAVAVAQGLQPGLGGADRVVLGALVLVALVAGWLVLRSLRGAIECRRLRLEDTRKHFGDPFKDARAVSKEGDPVNTVLAAAQVAGTLIAGWLVLFRV